MARTIRPSRATLGIALRWTAGTAATLAAAAAFNRFAARRAERRYPPAGRILDVDGVPVHVVDTGAAAGAAPGARPIVLVHGNGTLVQDLLVSGIVDTLRQRHRVILIDRPGYGYTARPDDRDWTAEAQAALLVRTCDQLGVENPIVVGHSWGTLVALAWAVGHPDKVGGIVLLSGYFYPTARLDAAMLAVTRIPGVKQLFTNAIAPLQTQLTGPAGLKLIFSPGKAPKHFMDDMPFELMLRPIQTCASALDGAQMPANVARLSKRYADITTPVAIAWGEADKLVGQDEQSARLSRQFHAAPVLILPETGHMIHHAAPAAVAAFIESAAR